MAKRVLPALPTTNDPDAIAQSYRNTFGSESGQVVLADLRRRFGRRSSFRPGQPDTTAFQEGQRDVYLMILEYLDAQQLQEETE